MKHMMLVTAAMIGFSAVCAGSLDQKISEFKSDLQFAVQKAEKEKKLSLPECNDWLYQLQNLDFDAAGNTAFDLVVTDYSADGTAGGEHSKSQIEGLKNSSGGKKIVVSYMSIGEAEDYRFYWKSDWSSNPPSWLDKENPEWKGNYKVKYWDKGWQKIIFSYMDRIIDEGFDGVYLDIIDAYEYYENENSDSAKQMIAFVRAIAEYGRSKVPGFIVIPQNGEPLLEDSEYRGFISGIGREDVWYNDDDPTGEEDDAIQYLDMLKKDGKPVFSVDYVRESGNIKDYYQKARAKGYVPYATVRDLNELTINSGYEPD